MRSPLRISLCIALLGAAIPVYAVPNMWSSGFGMGVTEYLITSPQHVQFNISCTNSPDDDHVLQHSVLVTMPNGKIRSSHDENTEITLVTDDEQYPIPSSLGWRNGDNAWLSFIGAISKAQLFDIWINDKKVATFMPSAGNVHKVLADISVCTSINDSE